MSSADIVNKLWNYCHVLRDDGMSYGDYVEQLTYLLFLKMADERTKPPYLFARGLSACDAQAGAQASNQKSPVPEKYGWPSALTPALSTPVPDFVLPPPSLESSRRERGNSYDGDELFDHYRRMIGGNL